MEELLWLLFQNEGEEYLMGEYLPLEHPSPTHHALIWNEELLCYQARDDKGIISSICSQASNQLIHAYMNELRQRKTTLSTQELYIEARTTVLSIIANDWGVELSQQALDAWSEYYLLMPA
jgi:hypothetical protein